MIITIVAAIGKNRQLGLNGKLIWKIEEDMKNFKNLTMNHHLLMGRKTFQSIGRALPHRENLVVSRKTDLAVDGAHIFSSPLEAVNFADNGGESELFVLGGATIYEFFLSRELANKMYLTEVDYEGVADVFFPKFNGEEWNVVATHPFERNSKNEYDGVIKTLVKN
ncbi:MAG: dihydrofolate reductase [Rickettsiales bacterium]|jgi:dihydrofolate reductase|nr:dihydrofolate reductase [Rickettsiales bacterium]